MKGWIVYRGFQLQQLASRMFCNLFMRCYGWLWGIDSSDGLQFFGCARYFRHPSARISIGNHVTFRSAPASNTMGLNRACFLSANVDATLIIGDGCGLSGTVIAAHQHISLGQRVMCGVNVTITDSDRHPLDKVARQQGHAGRPEPVYICDDVWLGMNVVVLKGVTIGAGAVIAANSVVVSDIPAGCLAAGQPAKVKRAI